MDCALGNPGDSGKNALLALSGVPWDDPPRFTFSVSLSLAQSHMSLGTGGLRSQGGIVLVAPINITFVCLPTSTPDLFKGIGTQ